MHGEPLDRDFSIRSVRLESVVRAALRANARALIDAGVAPHLEHLAFASKQTLSGSNLFLSQLLINAANIGEKILLPERQKLKYPQIKRSFCRNV